MQNNGISIFKKLPLTSWVSLNFYHIKKHMIRRLFRGLLGLFLLNLLSYIVWQGLINTVASPQVVTGVKDHTIMIYKFKKYAKQNGSVGM